MFALDLIYFGTALRESIAAAWREMQALHAAPVVPKFAAKPEQAPSSYG